MYVCTGPGIIIGLGLSPECGHCIMCLAVTLDSGSVSLILNWPVLTSIEILGSFCDSNIKHAVSGRDRWKRKSSTTGVTNRYVDLLDEQVFLIESHRKKTLKVKIADLEADLEVFQIKPCAQYIFTVNWKDQKERRGVPF